jgi:hypothetical protein
MTLSKKGLRKLNYHGMLFGWTIRPNPTYIQDIFHRPMMVAIQSLEAESPRILHVTLNIPRHDNSITPHQTAITPKTIEDIIDAALKNGWQPDGGGNAY